ncbi:MAG: hypothetical protein STHCBS139747_001106 [Sporothrix thermara]
MNNSAGAGAWPSGRRAQRSRANTAASSRARESRSSVSGKVREGVKKKLAFYTDMMTQLDMLVFAELCVLYYMDCSFFRFFIRAVAQSFFLSPKAEDFAIALDARRPHIFAIFAPNALCLLAHSLGALPTASEANRGYLHGGVIVDFVGQTAPTSKLGLVALDLVVLAVQCLMLAMHTEREKMRRLVVPMRALIAAAAATTPAAAAGTAAVVRAGGTPTPPPQPTPTLLQPPQPVANSPAATLQDHDAEERGMRGSRPQSPAGSGAAVSATSSPNEDERLHNIDLGGPAGAASPEEAAENELDALSSGTNIGDFYIIHAVQQAMQQRQGDSAAQSLQSIGYAVTLARLAAERRTRARATVAARPA